MFYRVAGNRRSSSSISSAICRHCFISSRYIERVVPSVTSNARSHSAALFRNITVRSPIILKQTNQGLRSRLASPSWRLNVRRWEWKTSASKSSRPTAGTSYSPELRTMKSAKPHSRRRFLSIRTITLKSPGREGHLEIEGAIRVRERKCTNTSSTACPSPSPRAGS